MNSVKHPLNPGLCCVYLGRRCARNSLSLGKRALLCDEWRMVFRVLAHRRQPSDSTSTVLIMGFNWADIRSLALRLRLLS